MPEKIPHPESSKDTGINTFTDSANAATVMYLLNLGSSLVCRVKTKIRSRIKIKVSVQGRRP
jgi:hypothetical protein